MGGRSKSYHENFDPANPNQIEATTSDIKTDLEKKTGINLPNFRSKLTPLSQSFFGLREFLLTELSFIKGLDAFKTETELIQQIEDFKWGNNA